MAVSMVMGNVLAMGVASLTLSPAAVGANTTAEQTFTCPGLRTTDIIVGVSKPTNQAGLGIVGWRVSAANTVAITWGNWTAGGLTPTAGEVYQIEWIRPESVQSGVNV